MNHHCDANLKKNLCGYLIILLTKLAQNNGRQPGKLNKIWMSV